MEGRSTSRNDPGRAVERTLRILEALAEGDGTVGESEATMALAEIAARAELPKSTTHRIVQTLVKHGYAASDGDGRYELGPQILRLAGRTFAIPLDYGRRVRPMLEELLASTKETVHFGVLRAGGCFYAEKLEPERPYRMASVVGAQLPLHSTAIGKAVLAHLPADERRLLLGKLRLARRTANTITDVGILEKELADVRDRGFSIDNQEDVEGIRCVGAPVFGNSRRVIGGISISGPAFTLSLDHALELAPQVVAGARATSLALGAPV